MFDPSTRSQPGLPGPIGSLQAEIIDPPLGSVKIEDAGDSVRLWAEDGESEVVLKSRVSVVGQRGPLLKLDWNGDAVLMDFGNSQAALEAIETFGATAATRTPASKPAAPPESDRDPVQNDRARHGDEPKDEKVKAEKPQKPQKPAKPATPERQGGLGQVVRNVGKLGVSLILLAAAVVVGVFLGPRLMGGGPAAPVGERSSDIVIRNEGGTEGGLELSPFTVSRPWMVNWKVEGGLLSVTAIASDGTEYPVTDANDTSEGSFEFSELGSFRIVVEADEGVQWRVIVLEERPDLSSDGQLP